MRLQYVLRYHLQKASFLEINYFALKLSSYNPEALHEMKKIIWEGTETWESLLFERAAITGKLVLSDFSRNALLQFKK